MKGNEAQKCCFTARPADFDIWGILSNHRVVEMFEMARWQWAEFYFMSMDEFKARGILSVVSNLSINYIEPLNFSPNVELSIQSEIVDEGTFSINLKQSLFSDRKLSEGELRLAFISKETGKLMRVNKVRKDMSP